jgi:hypothetical protein
MEADTTMRSVVREVDDVNADERTGLWPDDLHPRVDAVMTFIQGHVTVQSECDTRPDRDLAEWIALISGDIGRAAMLITRNPDEPDALRAAVAWLACASADGLRAHTARMAGAGRAPQWQELHAHLVSTLMSEPAWRPPIQVTFVIAALGELAVSAEPIVRAGPDAHGPVPRFGRDVTAVLRSWHPELATQAEAIAADDDADPVQTTLWALEDVWRSAAGAAVLLHPGGVVGMPAGFDDGPS